MQAGLFDTEHTALALPDADLSLWRGWLGEEAAENLYNELLETVEWSQPSLHMGGRPVKIPRLQAWYGDPEARYAYSGKAFQPLYWTSSLATIRHQLESHCGASFNSVLVNLYRDGNDGVGWHADNERELGLQPTIASVSLGTTRRFLLKPRQARGQRKPGLQTLALQLAHGDLLVMSGPTQQHWLHSIPKTRQPVGARINLTFRFIQVNSH